MRHIVCYSGGHSSSLVAIEVARRFGTADLILLNHDINPSVEDPDIKRFKREVAEYLGVTITYANHSRVNEWDQFDVCIDAGAFKVGNGSALCTNRLKTAPFNEYLTENFPNKDCVIYYGFDANERARIQRRSGVLGAMGYRSDYPLALWERSIQSTREIGIEPPLTYGLFKHANCVGCLKAKRQHWFLVFQTRTDIWEKAKHAEDEIGYSILPDGPLDDWEPFFRQLDIAGFKTTEHEDARTFWARVRREFKAPGDISQDEDGKPCECVF